MFEELNKQLIEKLSPEIRRQSDWVKNNIEPRFLGKNPLDWLALRGAGTLAPLHVSYTTADCEFLLRQFGNQVLETQAPLVGYCPDYDDDPRELAEIPEFRALCKRFIDTGFVNLFKATIPGKNPILGSSEIVVFGLNRIKYVEGKPHIAISGEEIITELKRVWPITGAALSGAMPIDVAHRRFRR